MTYRVSIKRPYPLVAHPSVEASLLSLTCPPYDIYRQHETGMYANKFVVDIPRDSNVIQLTATAVEGAFVSIEGDAVENGQPSDFIYIGVGATSLRIIVSHPTIF